MQSWWKRGSDLEIDMNPIFHCQNIFVVDCFGAAINFKQKVIQVAYEWSWSFVMSLPSWKKPNRHRLRILLAPVVTDNHKLNMKKSNITDLHHTCNDLDFTLNSSGQMTPTPWLRGLGALRQLPGPGRLARRLLENNLWGYRNCRNLFSILEFPWAGEMCSKRAVKRGPQEIFAYHVMSQSSKSWSHAQRLQIRWLLLHLEAICMRSCGCNDHLNHLHFHHIPMTFKWYSNVPMISFNNTIPRCQTFAERLRRSLGSASPTMCRRSSPLPLRDLRDRASRSSAGISWPEPCAEGQVGQVAGISWHQLAQINQWRVWV